MDTFVTYNPQSYGNGSLRVVLMKREQHTLWTYIGDLNRDAAIKVIFDEGCRELLGDGDDNIPSWFNRVDLIALRQDIVDMLERGDDKRDWYSAPIV